MDRNGCTRALATAAVVALAAGMAACGGDGEDDGQRAQEVARAKEEGRREAQAEQRARETAEETRRLRREVQKLRRETRERSRSGSGSRRSSGSGGGGSEACGDGVSVNSVTSCSFARNVKAEYEASGGASVIAVHSPVTGQTYRMRCRAGLPVICVGGNNAVVYLR